ncbi:MAG: ABC transporter permease [Porphyromonadaceae bacterium]|nr:MAG: ABC transporter permease [Porphyromonadaceae bacterium]
MNLPLFIAFRYFKARRSRHIINWISRISVAGITLGTMTLIIVLSVFNGLDHLIRSLFSSFDPDIKITAIEGKTFSADSILLSRVQAIPGVAYYCQVLEENALLKYRDRQAIATVKGVGPEFTKVSGIDSLLVDGEVRLAAGDTPMGVIGQELAGELGVGLNFINPIHVYVPKRSGRILLNPMQSINHRFLFPSGVFGIQQDYDSKYLIVPLDFARDFFDYSAGEVSALEIKITDARQTPDIIKKLLSVFGKDFRISDRLRQHADFYRVMSSEKWAIFLILSFILMVASFNTISSLTLLMLEKKTDMQILRSMGASQVKIRQVFLWEGLLVTGIGMMIGLILGAVFCMLQQQFGIIRFPNTGSFVVNVYPVRMLFSDFLLVIFLVGVIGYFAAWVPLRVMKKRYFATDSVDE